MLSCTLAGFFKRNRLFYFPSKGIQLINRLKFDVSEYDLTKLTVLFESSDGSVNLVSLNYTGHILLNLQTVSAFKAIRSL